MELTVLENGIIKPTKECLMIQPYQTIWERDRSEHKVLAMAEIAFIELMASPKKTNPFYGYSNKLPTPQEAPAAPIDEDQQLLVENTDESVVVFTSPRALKIMQNKFQQWPTWRPDRLIWQGIKQYQEFYYNASPYLSYYESNLVAANKVRDHYLTFDMNKMNLKTGMPIYKAKDITDGIKNANGVLTELMAMREKVDEEIFQNAKSRKNRSINHFER